MEKLIYTWEQQIDDTNLICEKIEADGFKPDVIVGISRGGLIPGVMISHKLSIPFKPVHASTRDFPHWENYLPKSNDSKVLIVDDICDSGETFERLSNYIKEKDFLNEKHFNEYSKQLPIPDLEKSLKKIDDAAGEAMKKNAKRQKKVWL